MKDFDEDKFDLDYLLFNERICRVCNQTKDLLTDFYLIRKSKKGYPSSYSYECKDCTKKRILKTRKKDTGFWIYPDW